MTWLQHIGISDYKRMYNLQHFVEVGCAQGVGIQHAYDSGFTKVTSCDINVSDVQLCLGKFPDANIFILEGLDFLKKALPKIEEPTLFWLDAQILNDDPTYREPYMPEIRLIKSLKPNYQHDVILCDDIRCFRSPDNPRYHPGEVQETSYSDIDWNKFTNILSDTHNFYLMQAHDGVAIFTPKS